MANRSIILLIVSNLFISAMSIGIYERFYRRAVDPKIAVLDIQALVAEQEHAAVSLLTNKNNSEETTNLMLSRIQQASVIMDQEIKAIAQVCNCIILPSGVLAMNSNVEDLTSIVRSNMNQKIKGFSK